MRRSIAALCLTLAACKTVPPPPTPAPAADAVPAVHGLTLEEEARVLALEDRREFDAALADAWTTHENPLHRARIALALGRIGPHTFVDANGNGERDPGERQAGVAQLTTLSHDVDRMVRETVAFSLGEIGDPSAIDTLFALAADPDGAVASEAVEALSKMAKDVGIKRYAELTSSNHPEGVRARAVRYLFRFTENNESGALAAFLLDQPSAAIRQEAAYALARRAYAPARDRLQLLISDPNQLVRAYAIAALGRIAEPESRSTLLAALADAHPWVRTNAAVAIARLAEAHPDIVKSDDLPKIIAAVEDVDPGTRASAVTMLGWYATKDTTAKKRLTDLATTGSRWERELAAGALARHFGEADLPADLSDWAKVRVAEGTQEAAVRAKLASDPSAMVRGTAVTSIPDAQVDAELEVIRRAMTDADVIVRASAVEKFAASKASDKLAMLQAAWEQAKGDRDNDARLAIIRALADLDYPEREAMLREQVGGKDPVARRVAAELIEEKLKKNRPQYTPLPVSRDDYAQIAEWSHHPHTAEIRMTRGSIALVLLPQDAPVTAWNFAQLAKAKFFDNTTFMRVVPNFVIQGGDPRNDMNGGPGYAIRDEINLQKYTRGAVGMALSGPDTGGSQFFITHSPQPHLDGGYTIFGRVVEGMSGVLDQTERGDKVETITIDGGR